jgi:hypothetical protein
MDVCNQGYGNLFFDPGDGIGSGSVRDRHTDDFAAGLCQLLNLSDGSRDVIGFGIGHGLDADGCPATHGNATHHDSAGFFSGYG